jgi:hypothetical protein
LIEHHETDAVEADEPLLGPEPEVTVTGLEDGRNGVLGKALLDRPEPVPVLGNEKLRIQG